MMQSAPIWYSAEVLHFQLPSSLTSMGKGREEYPKVKRLVIVAKPFVMQFPLRSSGSHPDSLLEYLKDLAVLPVLQ